VHKLLFLCFITAFSFVLQKNTDEKQLQLIQNLRSKAENHQYSMEERLYFAQKADSVSRLLKQDSIVISTNRLRSTLFLHNGDYETFKEINQENLILATNTNDTLVVGIANLNLGFYHHYIDMKRDSAYYHYSNAIKIYDKLNDQLRLIEALAYVSDLQETERDYIGAETNAVRALKLLENQPKTQDNLRSAYGLYNLLGIISLKLGYLDKSLEYHSEAEGIAAKMDEGFLLKSYSINNKAFVYRKKKNYDKALSLYNELLSDQKIFQKEDPTFYALIIDNIAYTKLLAGHKDYEAMEDEFMEAYKISDSLEDPVTKLAVSIDLSKFHLRLNQKKEALIYAEEAYNMAKEMNSNDILLESMMIMSKLKTGEEAKKYLNQHIQLSDSLLDVERRIRNKFARIEFETDKLQEENRRIAQERLWLTILSLGLLLTTILVYIIITQRAKNKELQFIQNQQKTNEEIYNLMLSQQDKVEEARANEKKRISKELHDGILGRLFGTRLSLDSLNSKEGEEAIKSRMNYIKELKIIEDDIRKISHELNTDFVSGSGFIDILSELIEKQMQAYQLKYDFKYTDDIDWELISNKTKINLYRIVQEAMQNIYKHAESQYVKISLQLKNNVILLTIEDDGKGFDINKSRKGIGIKNINSRIEEIEGVAKFDSKINQGTVLKITVPYKLN